METIESLQAKASKDDIKKDMLTYVAAKNVKKVAICVPARGMVEAGFLNNYITIFTFFMRQPGVIPLPIFSDRMPIDTARNDLCKNAIANKADYIFFLDSDVYLNESNLQALWDMILREDVHAVTGIYYLRDQPYTPVLRMEDGSGHMMPIPDFPKDAPFKVDGAGMGCFLMKRSALDAVYVATGGKPFWFAEDCSEDLNFCRRLRALKDSKGNPFEIWAHPTAQCGHYGAFVHEWHHLHYLGEELTEIAELHTYLKSTQNPALTRKDVLTRCFRAPYDIHNKFAKQFPGMARGAKYEPAEIDAFYQTIDDYLYDLSYYWFSRRKDAAEIFARIPRDTFRILDFGCGIGDYGLTALENFPGAHVVFYDINKPNLAYLDWRLKQRTEIIGGHGASFRVADSEAALDILIEEYNANSGLAPYRFQVVFCLDVLEHMIEPEKGINKIRDLMERNGLLFANVAAKSLLQSMHISAPDLTKYGFIQLAQYLYIRDDSDMAKNLTNLKV